MIKAIFYNYSAQVYTALLNVLLMPIYVRYMGTEAVGIIGFSLTLTMFINLIDSYFSQNLIRELALYETNSNKSTARDLIRTVETIGFVFILILIFSFYFSSYWISNNWFKIVNLKIDSVILSFKLIGGLIALKFFEGIYRNCLIGLNKIILLSRIQVIFATIRALGSVLLLIYFSSDLRFFFIWQILVSIITLIFLFYSTVINTGGFKITRKFSLLTLVTDKSFSLGMFFHTFLVLVFSQGDKLFLSRMLTLSEYGYYTIAGSVAGVVIMLVSPVSQTMLPRLVSYGENRRFNKLVEVYHLGCQIVTVVSGSFSVILIFYSRPILEFWLGAGNVSSGLPNLVAILVASNFLSGSLWMPNTLQFANKYTKITISSTIIAILFYFPLLLVCVPIYGAQGAGLILFGINMGLLLIGIYFFMFNKFIITERNNWLFKDLLIIVFAQFLFVYLSTFISAVSFSKIIFIAIMFTLTLVISILVTPTLRKLSFNIFNKRDSKIY